MLVLPEIDSPEQLREALIQWAVAGELEQAIRALDAAGILSDRLQEIHALKCVEQRPDYHSEGDVFEHTMLVLRNCAPGMRCQLAALLHDTGKPATMEVADGHISFRGHEKESAKIAESLLTRLGFAAAIVEQITTVVRYHMRPHFIERGGSKAVRKFLNAAGDQLDAVLELAEADARSSLGPDGAPAKPIENYSELRKRIKQVQALPPRPKPVLSGHVIMATLGISPGPAVGNANRWLREQAGDAELSVEEAKRLLVEEYSR